jgi:hypothetical protein
MTLFRQCRICGCTDISACTGKDGSPCCWVDDDLCSACAEIWDTAAVCDVLDERVRQVRAEGWTPEHDDGHSKGEMAFAGAVYAIGAAVSERERRHHMEIKLPFPLWPWDFRWWKSTTRRRDLVKSAALIIAEIERIDRAAEARTIDQ